MSALDVLTPKLNYDLFNAKTELRKVLQTKFPTYSENGEKIDITLQDLFYQRYDEYVDAKKSWAQKKINKKKQIAIEYPTKTKEDYDARKNEYIDWYGTVAESEILKVEEKLGKVLNIFSPNDMEIILGILESGGGKELYEARSIMDNVGKLNPDGGKVFPVTFYPQNWFKLLDTSFNDIDLIESYESLSQKIYLLKKEQYNLIIKKEQLISMIPDPEKIKDLQTAKNNAENQFYKTLTNLQQNYTDATMDILKIFINFLGEQKSNPKGNEKEYSDIITKENTEKFFPGSTKDETKVKNIIDTLNTHAKDCITNQNELIKVAEDTTKTAEEYFKNKNLTQLQQSLTELELKLKDINDEINELMEKRKLSKNIKPSEIDIESSVAPNNELNNIKSENIFTDVYINSKLSSLKSDSESKSKSSESTSGFSFFFGGHSSKQSHNEAFTSMAQDNEEMSIDIGMSIAKVVIEREWFNPGLFILTEDMYNTSNKYVSPPNNYGKFDDSRFDEMSQCIFPCFPTAFVIAKNVTIQFTSTKEMSNSFAQSIEDHASRGGGFFIFSGSESTSSSSSKTASSVTSSGKAKRIRFKNPQIIGYYLEATPADKSSKISNTETNTEFISIFEFIKNFQKVLDELNRKDETVI